MVLLLQGEDGGVIAQLMITYEWSDWRNMDIWWIQSVYVAPPFRRQGLFRLLYQHAKAESQRAGACGLRLYADVGNSRAHCTVGPTHMTGTSPCTGKCCHQDSRSVLQYEAMGMVSHYKVYEDLNTDY
jgi:GNAT superfamily N-acetyltransferase